MRVPTFTATATLTSPRGAYGARRAPGARSSDAVAAADCPGAACQGGFETCCCLPGQKCTSSAGGCSCGPAITLRAESSGLYG